jgi:hypothetical protein
MQVQVQVQKKYHKRGEMAVAACTSKNDLTHLGTGRMEVYDAELWAIGLALRESLKKRHTTGKRSVEGGCLAGGHPTDGAPGTGTRATTSQAD